MSWFYRRFTYMVLRESDLIVRQRMQSREERARNSCDYRRRAVVAL